MILKAVNSSAPLDASLGYAERKATRLAVINLRHPGLVFEEMKIVQLHYEKTHKRTSGKKKPKYPGVHYVLSCAPGEVEEPVMVLDMAKEFVARCRKFDGHQIELCLHEDRDHIHVHIIGNPVNRVTGKVLHVSRDEYREMIALQQQIGLEHGILPVEKGEHRKGDFVAEAHKKNQVVRQKGRDADIVVTYQAVDIARHTAASWDEFESLLLEKGVLVEKSPTRKHIVFGYNGRRFRDTNLSKTFSDDLGKEALDNEFLDNERKRINERIAGDLERRERCTGGIDNLGLLSGIHREERTRERALTRERG